jgi:RNA polymerase sigma factor (sigma-70 family)
VPAARTPGLIGSIPEERVLSGGDDAFRACFETLFDAHHPRIFRYLDRLTGDPDLAADLAQQTFVQLYRRGSSPDEPGAWLITVARNLLRNDRSKASRRRRLLGRARGRAQGDPAASPAASLESERTRRAVRAALDRLPERDRSLLLLRAEGYSYRELARALALKPSSVGTMLARARATFRTTYQEARDD